MGGTSLPLLIWIRLRPWRETVGPVSLVRFCRGGSVDCWAPSACYVARIRSRPPRVCWLCDTVSSLPRRLIGSMRPIPQAASIAGQLPRHRRHGPPQPTRDHPQRGARSYPSRDLLPLGNRQLATRAVTHHRTHPTRRFHHSPNRRPRPSQPTPNRPVQLTRLASLPHLPDLGLREHRPIPHLHRVSPRPALSCHSSILATSGACAIPGEVQVVAAV